MSQRFVFYNQGATVQLPLIETGKATYLAADPTMEAGDARISIDGGAWANTANLPTWLGEGWVQVVLTAAETAGSHIVVKIVDQTVPADFDPNSAILTTDNAEIIASGSCPADAPSSSTISLGARIGTMEPLNSQIVNLRTGESNLITGYDAGTKVATVARDWNDDPTSGDNWYIKAFGVETYSGLDLFEPQQIRVTGVTGDVSVNGGTVTRFAITGIGGNTLPTQNDAFEGRAMTFARGATIELTTGLVYAYTSTGANTADVDLILREDAENNQAPVPLNADPAVNDEGYIYA